MKRLFRLELQRTKLEMNRIIVKPNCIYLLVKQLPRTDMAQLCYLKEKMLSFLSETKSEVRALVYYLIPDLRAQMSERFLNYKLFYLNVWLISIDRLNLRR